MRMCRVLLVREWFVDIVDKRRDKAECSKSCIVNRTPQIDWSKTHLAFVHTARSHLSLHY